MTNVIPALGNLTPEERRQLLERLRRDGVPAQARDYPLSWNQEGLWLLEKLDRGRGHVISAALRLSGPLDIDSLRTAHTQVLERHDILRTTFHDLERGAVQRVHAKGVAAFTVIDADEASVDELLTQHIGESFDLERLPLLRSTLLRLGPDEHVWLMTAHHIIFDGWSVGVFVREIAAFYEARMRSESPGLASLSLQYSAFAAAQRSQQETERINRDIAWWRQQLEGGPGALDLPFDRNRGPRLSEDGAIHFFDISQSVSDRLQTLATGAGATLYMALLTVFSALLSRYSGQSDLVVGTPAANRGRPEREPALGFFVSALPLRINLSRRPTFFDLLRRVKETCVQAFVHQDVPFERIVKELRIPRDPSRNPLFQTMFGLRNMDTSFELHGLRATPLRVKRTTSQFDLTLLMKETSSGIEGAFEYSTDLFDAPTVERMGRHFRNLLEAVVAAPDAELCTIDFLTPEERSAHRISTVSRVEPADIVAQFEAVARRHPGKTAVLWEGGPVSYAELDQRADQVAAELSRLGAGVEALVGLDARRSPSSIAGLLGILKSGAAFVPLDPEYPPERLGWMAADSNIRLIVSDAEQVAALPQSIVRVRTVRPIETRFVSRTPNTQALAYVIYTSGSTGQPKGVAISRGALAHFCAAAREQYPIQSSDRVLQFASLSFDTSLEEILPSLTAGATLVLRTDAMLEDPARLLDACRSHAITVLNLPTSWWKRMSVEMTRLRFPLPESIRTIIIGGEACSREALATWKAVESRATRLLNTYGPTETCVAASMADLLGERNESQREVSIGSAIGDAHLMVADSNMQPTPFGVLGELLIGGPGVARGYLGRPALTAERFLPSPGSDGDGARTYRTGDLVRLRRDGNIEYVGRTDHQSKIRGLRIEPGEVENAISMYPGVAGALVVIREDSLCAFLTAEDGVAIHVEALRRFLRSRLPYFMVPSQIHVVAEFAKLPNGKINRKHLPVVEAARPESRILPATDVEAKLAEIWKAILRVEEVGTHDNFFALGGDSIMTIQVAARAVQQSLPIASRDLFEHQTIAELAAEIESRLAQSAPDAEENHIELPGPYALSPIQQWFFSRNYGRPSHFNQSVLLEVAADVDFPKLADALRTVFARHEAFRLRFHRDGESWKQSISPSFDPGLVQIVDAIDVELQRRLDIEAGPVIRAALMPARQPGSSGRLLVVAHHLVIDAVSWRILVGEVASTYAGNLLPPKTRPFTTWPLSLANHASSLKHERIRMWTERPPDSLPIAIDVDVPSEANTVASREQIVLYLDSEETATLLRSTTAALDARIDELVLAACAEAMIRWAGADSLLVDLESHGRPELAGCGDYSRTVGWFTSLYPIRLAPDDYVLNSVLREVRRAVRSIPDGGIDYGALRYIGKDEQIRAKLASMSDSEISFNYLGRIDSSLQYPFTAIAQESHGDTHDPEEVRSHVIEIAALIDAGALRIEWTYSSAFHRRGTIQSLAEASLDNVRSFMADAKQTPSPYRGGVRDLNRSIMRTRRGAQ